MLEIRFHGRGGQGAVTASKALAIAAATAGYFVQTFPEFGVERRGAPVAAFARIDSAPIHVRSKIYHPTDVYVLDPTLLKAVNVTDGVAPGGRIVINSDKDAAAFHLPAEFDVKTFDATGIAVRHGLGSRAAPIVNTPILGIFTALTGLFDEAAMLAAVREIAPVKVEENIAAARDGYAAARKEAADAGISTRIANLVSRPA